MNDKHSYGRGAESLVKAHLEMRGFNIFTTSHASTTKDLIAESQAGNLYSVQVKSFNTKEESYDVDIRRPSAKNRHYGDNAYDILALVDIDTLQISFIHSNEITERGIKRSIRVWRRLKSEYATKTPYRNEPIFYEDYSSFENAIGKRFEDEAV